MKNRCVAPIWKIDADEIKGALLSFESYQTKQLKFQILIDEVEGKDYFKNLNLPSSELGWHFYRWTPIIRKMRGLRGLR